MTNANYAGEHEADKQMWRAAFASQCISHGVKDIFTLANPDGRDVKFFESQGLLVGAWTEANGDIRKMPCLKPQGLFFDPFGTATSFEDWIEYQINNNSNLKVLYLNFSVRDGRRYEQVKGFRLVNEQTYNHEGPMHSALFVRDERQTKTVRRKPFLERYKENFGTRVVTTTEVGNVLGKGAIQQLFKHAGKGQLIRYAVEKRGPGAVNRWGLVGD